MRLLNHVEGITEETFTNEILAPHLIGAGYESVSARLIGNARLRSHRGGTRAWVDVKKDIVRHLQSDQGAVATTMVDYYALPASGPKEWPGRADANKKQFAQKARTVQTELLKDVVADMGRNFDPKRFVPFVVMYEFEDCYSAIVMLLREQWVRKTLLQIYKKYVTNSTPQRRLMTRR